MLEQVCPVVEAAKEDEVHHTIDEQGNDKFLLIQM